MLNAQFPSMIVVERQPLMLTALSTALAAEGIQVLAEVRENSLVLPTVQRLQPELILYSVGEPCLPDLERISALRHEFPGILILALLSREFRGQERMALDYGAHRTLSKTAPRAELLAELSALAQNEMHLRLAKPTPHGTFRTPIL